VAAIVRCPSDVASGVAAGPLLASVWPLMVLPLAAFVWLAWLVVPAFPEAVVVLVVPEVVVPVVPEVVLVPVLALELALAPAPPAALTPPTDIGPLHQL
jgi:hypothetical protein